MCCEAANFQHNGPCSHLLVSGAQNIKVFAGAEGKKMIWDSYSDFVNEAKKRQCRLLVERISQGDPSVCVVESSAPLSFWSWGWQWQEPHQPTPRVSEDPGLHFPSASKWGLLCTRPFPPSICLLQIQLKCLLVTAVRQGHLTWNSTTEVITTLEHHIHIPLPDIWQESKVALAL